MHVLTPSSADAQTVTSELQSALDMHRHVRLAPGVWPCGTITVPDGTRLDGPGATIVRDDALEAPFRNTILLDASGKRDVAISDITIDLYVSRNGVVAINARDGAEDIRVERVRVVSSLEPLQTWEPLAVLFKGGSRGLTVRDCYFHRCQVKANGGSKDIRVVRCVSQDACSFGVSVVTNNEDVDTERVSIIGNTIINPSVGGVFVGADGDSQTVGGLHHLLIQDNIVIAGSRALSNSWVGIIARAPKRARGWRIYGNDVDAGDVSGSFALLVKTIDAGPELFDDVEIIGGSYRNSDHQDVRVMLLGTRASIASVHAEGGRGVRVWARGGHSVVTITGLRSIPRGTFASLVKTEDAGASVDVIQTANYLPGGGP